MRLQTQVAPEIQKRLLLSRVEAESLKERDILCPTCGFRIQRVFSDATGHLSVKCQKCKNNYTVSCRQPLQQHCISARDVSVSRTCEPMLYIRLLC